MGYEGPKVGKTVSINCCPLVIQYCTVKPVLCGHPRGITKWQVLVLCYYQNNHLHGILSQSNRLTQAKTTKKWPSPVNRDDRLIPVYLTAALRNLVLHVTRYFQFSHSGRYGWPWRVGTDRETWRSGKCLHFNDCSVFNTYRLQGTQKVLHVAFYL